MRDFCNGEKFVSGKVIKMWRGDLSEYNDEKLKVWDNEEHRNELQQDLVHGTFPILTSIGHNE